MLKALCHSSARGWVDVADLADVSELRAQDGNLIWGETDIATLDAHEIATIAEEFALHPLAVEDAVHARQRPKAEPYPTHLFLVFHQLDEVDGQLEATQIACFVGDGYLLAIHAGASRTLEETKERLRRDPPPDNHPSGVLHTLLDTVVDDYQRIADGLENQIEELEELVLEHPDITVRPDTNLQRQIYSVKQRVARLRRYVFPATRLLEWTHDHGGQTLYPPAMANRFRDVHDHLMRITEEVRNVDELVRAVLDFTRGEQAEALNEVTKKLTSWAAIVAVWTVIAGVYGMNFSLVPPTDSRIGFWFALGLMAATGIALYAYFKRRNWL